MFPRDTVNFPVVGTVIVAAVNTAHGETAIFDVVRTASVVRTNRIRNTEVAVNSES